MKPHVTKHMAVLFNLMVKIMATRLFPTLWQKMSMLLRSIWLFRTLDSQGVVNCGHRVRTLTNAIGRDDPFDDQVEVRPIDFTNHDSLCHLLLMQMFYTTPIG